MSGIQSALEPAGRQASHIATLWWILFFVLGAIFVAVCAVTLWSLTRRHRGVQNDSLETTHQPSTTTEARLTRVVGVASIATVVIVFGLIVTSVSTGKAISSLNERKDALAIEVVGNQWWWYVRYLNEDPSRIVVTANEIHVPVGRPVMIRGSSHDVIHSLWIPNLHGKRDLVPSRISTTWIQADRPGRFRGQCAEFCGMQHAHMALWVVAEPQAEFEAWMQRQLQTAVDPTDPHLVRGKQIFLSKACIFCHNIGGTPASGQVAPDLTHFGSRLTIAAGTLNNTKGNLAGWIVDPQNVKAGNHMSTINLSPGDLQPLVDYLESLQ